MPCACVRIGLISSPVEIVRIAANSVQIRPLCASGRHQASKLVGVRFLRFEIETATALIILLGMANRSVFYVYSSCFVLLVDLLLVCPVKGAEEPLVLPVWPGTVPGDYGTIGPERVRAPSEAPTKNAKWITGVTKPTITVFRPAKDKNTGTAILICPGGGYWNLAWDLEGEEVAAWFNTVGVTGFVLKYRVPRRAGQPEPLPAPGPLLDAQRAVSLVRSRAAEWGIDTKRIGILGFSAGGHLAVATATHFDQRAYEPIDEIDKISCRPDFAVAVYPGYFIEQHPAGVETNKHILAS